MKGAAASAEDEDHAKQATTRREMYFILLVVVVVVLSEGREYSWRFLCESKKAVLVVSCVGVVGVSVERCARSEGKKKKKDTLFLLYVRKVWPKPEVLLCVGNSKVTN